RKLGLDRDPRVVQAMEAAKRDLLAKAYLDTLAEKAPLPSSDEIDRYYETQPALFSQRRFYMLNSLTVEGTPEQIEALRPKLEAPGARASDLLRDAGRRFSARQVSVAAEDVPLALLDRLAGLREGQSLVLPQPGGARVLTVIESRAAPLPRDQAVPAIRTFLTNERKRQSLQEGMKALRASARIEYVGRFAQAASQPAGEAPAVAAR
ncbi:MAG TPA: peptidyl-prolyl cis-trans isomerase, partial [Albitalea sp.]